MLFKRLRAIWDFGTPPGDPATADSVPNLIERKSNHLHELFILTTFFSGILFAGQDFIYGRSSEALISFVLTPVSAVSYSLFRYGHIRSSKILNNIQTIVIPGIIQLTLVQQTGLIAFYFPISIGAFVVFQGKDRPLAFVIMSLCVITAGFLLFSDFRIAGHIYNDSELFRERFFNISSALAITSMVFVFLLVLGNRIQAGLFKAQLDIRQKMNHLAALNRELDERNHQLVQTNSELDSVVYRVSHDLRSPLLSVKGLLNLMGTLPDLSTSAREYTTMAGKTLDRLDETIGEILIFTSNARKDLEPEEFSLKTLVYSIFDDLRFLAGSSFQFKYTCEGSDSVLHDRYRMNIILKNLIGNAVKYARKDIPDPSVNVTIRNAGDDIRITISDNGQGIPEHHQPKVFEMFYRASTETVGTGLGLYICAEMIRKMGGTVELTSVPGQGTSVAIGLPTVKSA